MITLKKFGTDILSMASATELTLVSGTVTLTQTLHRVDTEGDAVTDDLDTILGGTDGNIIVVRAENGTRTVTLKDGTGNLKLGGRDLELLDTNMAVMLFYSEILSQWLLIGDGGGSATAAVSDGVFSSAWDGGTAVAPSRNAVYDIMVTKSDTSHLHDDRYYTEDEVDSLITTISGKLDDHNELNNLDYASAGHTGFQPAGDYATDAELTTVSGVLQTNIDGKSDTGHTHIEADISDLDHDAVKLRGRDISSTDTPNDGESITWYANGSEWRYTMISGGSGGSSNHSELNELDYASAGHTGFASSASQTTLSGNLQTNIDGKIANVIEDTDPELGGDLDCGDYNLDNVGKFCSISISTRVCNNTGSTLTKGTAVTICSLYGETCCVCVSDNRELTKMPVCGVIYTDITDGNEGCGITLGRINMDTSGMTGNEGDRLYVQGDGSMDTVIPTSGSVQRVGILVKKAAGSAGRVCICIRGRRSVYAAKDEHIILRMGSDAGHQKVVFKDYNNAEVAQIDSSGNLTLSGTVDGVDIATLKSDYDGHTHTEVDIIDLDKYTEAEVDTISGSLQTDIDGKDNYSNWSFAVDGVTKDAVTSCDILNFVGSDNITITRSADDEITISGTTGGIASVVEDTTPQLGGELDAGVHSIGFTLQTYSGIVATTTIDWTTGNKAKFTFGAGNETLAFTAPSKPCSLQLILIQDLTGSRTITWPTVKWAGGIAPVLSTAANAVDIVSFLFDGTNYYGVGSLNFS